MIGNLIIVILKLSVPMNIHIPPVGSGITSAMVLKTNSFYKEV